LKEKKEKEEVINTETLSQATISKISKQIKIKEN
jgi:hypothetical protein